MSRGDEAAHAAAEKARRQSREALDDAIERLAQARRKAKARRARKIPANDTPPYWNKD